MCKTLKKITYGTNGRLIQVTHTHVIFLICILAEVNRAEGVRMCFVVREQRDLFKSEPIVFEHSNDFIVVRCICNYISYT